MHVLYACPKQMRHACPVCLSKTNETSVRSLAASPSAVRSRVRPRFGCASVRGSVARPSAVRLRVRPRFGCASARGSAARPSAVRLRFRPRFGCEESVRGSAARSPSAVSAQLGMLKALCRMTQNKNRQNRKKNRQKSDCLCL